MGCDSGACVCYASFECVGMCKYDDVNASFVLCMLVCSAADTLVVAAGFRYNSSVHFAAAVFAHKKKLYHVLFSLPIYSDASL